MDRGLVAVRVGGGDAEREQMSQMLDAFDAGGPVEAVIELAAQPEPEFAPDVHDLFVTEPEAVEEWQVAAVDSWAVAEAGAVRGVRLGVSAGSRAGSGRGVCGVQRVGRPRGPRVPGWTGAGALPELSGGGRADPLRARSRGIRRRAGDVRESVVRGGGLRPRIRAGGHESDPQAYILDPTGDDVVPVDYESASAFVETEPISSESQAPTYERRG